MDTDFLLTVLALAVATFACRAAGFAMMRFVRVTPRLDAALKAVPIAVMVGLVTPAALSGRAPELLAIVIVVVAMRRTGNDLLSALAGLVVVAAGRWLGF